MIVIRRLIWDPGNVAHTARHGVASEEVEEVCAGRHIARQTYQDRIILIGPTHSDRMLAVVLEPIATGEYYPVTARSASRNTVSP